MEEPSIASIFSFVGQEPRFSRLQAAESSPAIPSGDVDLEAAKTELKQAMQQAEEEARRQITEPEEAREPNPWLRRVGWVEHSEAFDREELRALVAPIKDDEPELEVLCRAFDWLIQDANTIAFGRWLGWRHCLRRTERRWIKTSGCRLIVGWILPP
jgi:O-methyltransferase involved in polyketide biosynthesis